MKEACDASAPAVTLYVLDSVPLSTVTVVSCEAISLKETAVPPAWEYAMVCILMIGDCSCAAAREEPGNTVITAIRVAPIDVRNCFDIKVWLLELLLRLRSHVGMSSGAKLD